MDHISSSSSSEEEDDVYNAMTLKDIFEEVSTIFLEKLEKKITKYYTQVYELVDESNNKEGYRTVFIELIDSHLHKQLNGFNDSIDKFAFYDAVRWRFNKIKTVFYYLIKQTGLKETINNKWSEYFLSIKSELFNSIDDSTPLEVLQYVADDLGFPYDDDDETKHEDYIPKMISENPLIWDADGDTQLHKAIKNEDIEEIKRLCQLEVVKKNARQNRYGLTPLFLACQLGNEDIVDLMIQYFPEDLNTTDDQGRTPLEISKDKLDIAFMLRDAGAKKKQTGEKYSDNLDSNVPFYSFFQARLKEFFTKDVKIAGFRFPFRTPEDSEPKFQEVILILHKEELAFGMMCEEYPTEKKAYISYLEARFNGLGLSKFLLTEYAVFLSIRYPSMDLHIWADPPPAGKNYLFNGSKVREGTKILNVQTKQVSKVPKGIRFANDLQEKYFKDFTEAGFECQVYQLKISLPKFPSFFSRADSKFSKIEDSMMSLSSGLESIINLNFQATLICPLSKGVKIPPERVTQYYDYITTDFFLKDGNIDFETNNDSQKNLFKKLELYKSQEPSSETLKWWKQKAAEMFPHITYSKKRK